MNLRAVSTFHLTLGISIAVHAVLLTVRFVDPESFNRVFADTPLEVVLVNARTNEKPDKAKAIAQTSMAGGGEADPGHRATSPLPPSALTDVGDTMEEESARKLQTLQEQQTLLLSQVKKQLAALPPRDPRKEANKADEMEREEKRRQLIMLLAEIERRINKENSRPKKRFIAPSTMGKVYAVYYDGLRRAIEDQGTENFPRAGGKKLYGELTMIVTVNHDGHVLNTEIVVSSGNTTLDRQAASIARKAGPFGNFSKEMLQEAGQIVVVSRFKFTRDETLEAKVSSQP